MNRKMMYKPKVKAPLRIMVSFLVFILLGALLLNLPAASQSGERVGFLNALFTATSAACVTGLVVVNTLAHWTLFGKIVILILIQFGALGIMTVLTLGMLLLGRRIALKDRLVIQASYNQEQIGGMVRLVRNVFLYTAVLESAGALLLTLYFYIGSQMPLGVSIYKGIFHAVSAFCNAGFDIIGSESLTPYRGSVYMNLVIMALIIAGGLGFTVLAELQQFFHNKKKRSFRKRLHHLSLHSKIALIVTACLLVSGTLLFLLLEWTNPETLAALPAREKLLAAMFQSTTLRTAGFNTISQAALTEGSQLISCFYMVIGGSPAGTAGGLKTVTLGIIVITMFSALQGRERIESFGRTLPLDLLQKALTVICAMFIVVFVSTLILLFTEQGSPFDHSFLDLLFECSSAAGTAGISTGITPHLSSAGKIVVSICMFLGRLSPVTVVVALTLKLQGTSNHAKYIDERVIIG